MSELSQDLRHARPGDNYPVSDDAVGEDATLRVIATNTRKSSFGGNKNVKVEVKYADGSAYSLSIAPEESGSVGFTSKVQ